MKFAIQRKKYATIKQHMTFSATEARQNFSKLLKLAEQGEEVIILRENKDHSITRFTITKREEEEA